MPAGISRERRSRRGQEPLLLSKTLNLLPKINGAGYLSENQ